MFDLCEGNLWVTHLFCQRGPRNGPRTPFLLSAGAQTWPPHPPLSPARIAGDSFARATAEVLGVRVCVATLELFEVRVLEGQALAADAGEMDGGDDVGALALDADEESLAPARVAQLGAHAEGQVVVLGLGGGA